MASRKKSTSARSRGGRLETGGPRRAPAGAAGKSGKSLKAGRSDRPAAAPSRFPEVEELVELMNRHELLEVDYQIAPDGSRRIKLARAGAGGFVMAAPAAAPRSSEPSAAAAPGTEAAPAAAPGETLHAFKSPMVGTFYRAPSPEAPPFASVGDKLDPHATVCIIEAMKVMNEITPDISGTVVSIEVENGEAVEFGQTLFLVRPS